MVPRASAAYGTVRAMRQHMRLTDTSERLDLTPWRTSRRTTRYGDQVDSMPGGYIEVLRRQRNLPREGGVA